MNRTRWMLVAIAVGVAAISLLVATAIDEISLTGLLVLAVLVTISSTSAIHATLRPAVRPRLDESYRHAYERVSRR